MLRYQVNFKCIWEKNIILLDIFDFKDPIGSTKYLVLIHLDVPVKFLLLLSRAFYNVISKFGLYRFSRNLPLF